MTLLESEFFDGPQNNALNWLWHTINRGSPGIYWPQGPWELLASGTVGIIGLGGPGNYWPQGPWELLTLGAQLCCGAQLVSYCAEYCITFFL